MIMISEWWNDFEWAKYEPGSFNRNLLLYSIGLSMQATVTVEIGIGQLPNGIYLLGQLAKELEAEHIAIDIAQTPINRAKQIIEKYDLPVTILHFDSKAITWTRKIDLLYIDGGHDYQSVRGDLRNYAHWVRRNGFMILDDYGKRHLKVTEAFDDYMEDTKEGTWEVFSIPSLWWKICRRL